MTGAVRRVLVVANARREGAISTAGAVAEELLQSGVEVCVPLDDAAIWAGEERVVRTSDGEDAADGCDVVIVLGGDGTVLRGAERARGSQAPLIGVNLGHVGFLAEAESEAVHEVVAAVVAGKWRVEERATLEVRAVKDGHEVFRTWALNEIALEKRARERMIELVAEIDARPLSRWGCDGVVCATPTGSTAYAFSAGGPVVWPEVDALLVVPLSAHALFARPMVVSPYSTVAFELADWSAAVLSADGRRNAEIPAGTRIEVQRGAQPVRFARLHDAPFTDRIVAKFELPTQGWAGPRRRDAAR